MKNLITNKLDVIMFTVGILTWVSFMIYVVYNVQQGNYYMSF